MIEIPYFVNGEEVNCKTRSISGEKKFYQVKDGAKVFYNHRHIEQWEQTPAAELLILEGEMDCMIAIQHGYLAVSVPDGAPAQRVHDEDSAKYTFLNGFPRKGTVILCCDNDEAGTNLLHDLADRLGRQRCKWIRYPKGMVTNPDGSQRPIKDLNDVALVYGEKGIRETIRRAEWLRVDGVYRMSELPPSPAHEPMPCEVLPHNLRTSEMSVWTGIPGHGKSTLLNFISYLIASTTLRGQKTPARGIGYASFEQEPQTEHRFNLRTLFLGFRADNASQEDLAAADAWIDKQCCFIVPDIDSDVDADLTWLLEKMAVATARYGTTLFIIDPWNELDHCFDRREMNSTDYTGFAVKQLKKFAKRYRVHVAVIAHPSKLKKERNGKYPIPNLYEIADSAHWYNKPDLGVVVHRKDGYTLVRVQKSRYQEEEKIGPTGDFWLDFDPVTKRYTQVEAPPVAFKPPRKKKGEAAAAPADKDDPQNTEERGHDF